MIEKCNNDAHKDIKKYLLRFLKEYGVYKFITGEIKKEYNNIDAFITSIIDRRMVKGVFNKVSVLSFEWREENRNFWKPISDTWISECLKNRWL